MVSNQDRVHVGGDKELLQKKKKDKKKPKTQQEHFALSLDTIYYRDYRPGRGNRLLHGIV